MLLYIIYVIASSIQWMINSYIRNLKICTPLNIDGKITHPPFFYQFLSTQSSTT